MKKLLKWFTLVEILIVIVIIGILIWALVPRMSAAQGRARDVARKNDLANLQAAIVVAYQDKWQYPCVEHGSYHWCYNGDETTSTTSGTKAGSGVSVDKMKSILEAAWMNTVPRDPLGSNSFYWLWTNKSPDWEYMYITLQSHWIDNWWFAVMAKTEIAWWSNWIVCTNEAGTGITYGEISMTSATQNNRDVKTIKLCENITQSGNCTNDWAWNCTYKDERDLRYIMTY